MLRWFKREQYKTVYLIKLEDEDGTRFFLFEDKGRAERYAKSLSHTFPISVTPSVLYLGKGVEHENDRSY